MIQGEYQLYVSNNCDGCTKIIAELEKEAIFVKMVNIDQDHIQLPFTPLILPALVKKKKLIRYGANDILELLRKIN